MAEDHPFSQSTLNLNMQRCQITASHLTRHRHVIWAGSFGNPKGVEQALRRQTSGCKHYVQQMRHWMGPTRSRELLKNSHSRPSIPHSQPCAAHPSCFPYTQPGLNGLNLDRRSHAGTAQCVNKV